MTISKRMRAGLVAAGLGTALAAVLTTAANAGGPSDGVLPGSGTGVPATYCPHAPKMVKKDAAFLADDGTGLPELKPGDRVRAVRGNPAAPGTEADGVAEKGTAESTPGASGTGTTESGTTEKTTPARVAPGQTAGGSGTAEEVEPVRVAPGQAPGESGTPEETAPEETTTEDGTAGHDAPITVAVPCPTPSATD